LICPDAHPRTRCLSCLVFFHKLLPLLTVRKSSRGFSKYQCSRRMRSYCLTKRRFSLLMKSMANFLLLTFNIQRGFWLDLDVRKTSKFQRIFSRPTERELG